ncbi:talanin isoform X1 [Homo sapiens]|uniref:talanin isoform X1 n=1 Tax=Homo sapiens TaxID=9606 RepID=UPI0005D00C33|nr:talanin isoform X1 [Homo sapiens]|eukprot:XP_016871427.1 protein ZNF365 isoform X2 [Homo sapiens]
MITLTTQGLLRRPRNRKRGREEDPRRSAVQGVLQSRLCGLKGNLPYFAPDSSAKRDDGIFPIGLLCWNTERNQTDKNPCLHGAYLQLRETVKNKSTHLKKPLMKQAPPWKDHLTFQPLHPAERKTQVWRWQSGFSQIWVLFPFCGGTFHHNEKDVLGLQDFERESVSTSQSRNISLLTLGQLQNCVIGKLTIIDLLTEHLLGVRHGVICFPWGLPSSS